MSCGGLSKGLSTTLGDLVGGGLWAGWGDATGDLTGTWGERLDGALSLLNGELEGALSLLKGDLLLPEDLGCIKGEPGGALAEPWGVLICVSPTEPEDLEVLCGLEPLSEDLSGTFFFFLFRLPLMGFSRGFLRLWQMQPPKTSAVYGIFKQNILFFRWYIFCWANSVSWVPDRLLNLAVTLTE